MNKDMYLYKYKYKYKHKDKWADDTILLAAGAHGVVLPVRLGVLQGKKTKTA